MLAYVCFARACHVCLQEHKPMHACLVSTVSILSCGQSVSHLWCGVQLRLCPNALQKSPYTCTHMHAYTITYRCSRACNLPHAHTRAHTRMCTHNTHEHAFLLARRRYTELWDALQVVKEVGSSERTSAVDLAVYSRTRHFRIAWSCKGGK